MDLENWVGCMQDKIKDKKLSEIVIPGTHDSGSYCINRKSRFVLILNIVFELSYADDFVPPNLRCFLHFYKNKTLILGSNIKFLSLIRRTYLLPNLYCLNPVVDVVGAVWSRTQDFSIAVS